MAFSKRPLSIQPPSTWLANSANAMMFFGAVTLFSGFIVYQFFVQPVLDVWAARSWPATPRSIVSSEVGKYQGNSGPTYGVKIVFTYRVGGQQYESPTYDFLNGTSSSHDEKQAVVNQYPPGKRTVCYVDPSDPTDAVLDRDYPDGLTFGAILTIFPAIGVWGLARTLKRGKQSGEAVPSPQPAVPVRAGAAAKVVLEDRSDTAPETAAPDIPVALAPTVTSGRRVLINLLVLLAFGGFLVGYIVQNPPASNKGGSVDSSAPIGLLLFGGVTLASLVSTIKAFMRLADPRIHLRVVPGTVRLGRDFTLEWEARGGGRKLSRLCIAIQCQEESDFQNIKSISVDTSVCYHADLVDTQQADKLAAGKLTMRLPHGAMHSFNGGRNRIGWKITVTGTAPGWVGVKDEYPLMVLPDGWEGAL